MAERLVKCKYCGGYLSRAEEPYMKVSNRYAHQKCFDIHAQEASDFKRITDLVKSLYMGREPNWRVIGTQLKKYKSEGMTYKGIYYTLVYFFEIKKNDVTKSAGIGIVPYQYKKAELYYNYANNVRTQTARIEQDGVDVITTEEIVIINQKIPEKQFINFEY